MPKPIVGIKRPVAIMRSVPAPIVAPVIPPVETVSVITETAETEIGTSTSSVQVTPEEKVSAWIAHGEYAGEIEADAESDKEFAYILLGRIEEENLAKRPLHKTPAKWYAAWMKGIPVAPPIEVPTTALPEPVIEPVAEAPKPIAIKSASENLQSALQMKAEEAAHEARRKAEAETLNAAAKVETLTAEESEVSAPIKNRRRSNSPKPGTTPEYTAPPEPQRAAPRFDEDPPEVVPSSSEVDAAREHRGKVPTVKNHRSDLTSTERRVVAGVSPMKFIGGCLVAIALGAFLVGIYKMTEKSPTGETSEAGVIPLPSKPSSAPTSTPSAPMSAEVAIPKEGLPMTPENLQKVFGQSDPKSYRKNPEWKEGDPFFCFCPNMPDSAIMDVSSCRICQ